MNKYSNIISYSFYRLIKISVISLVMISGLISYLWLFSSGKPQVTTQLTKITKTSMVDNTKLVSNTPSGKCQAVICVTVHLTILPSATLNGTKTQTLIATPIPIQTSSTAISIPTAKETITIEQLAFQEISKKIVDVANALKGNWWGLAVGSTTQKDTFSLLNQYGTYSAEAKEDFIWFQPYSYMDKILIGIENGYLSYIYFNQKMAPTLIQPYSIKNVLSSEKPIMYWVNSYKIPHFQINEPYIAWEIIMVYKSGFIIKYSGIDEKSLLGYSNQYINICPDHQIESGKNDSTFYVDVLFLSSLAIESVESINETILMDDKLLKELYGNDINPYTYGDYTFIDSKEIYPNGTTYKLSDFFSEKYLIQKLTDPNNNCIYLPIEITE